jgi:tRNA (guanine37-N1)-methyltransferase
MHIDFLTLLPHMVAPVLQASVVGRACAAGRFTWRAVPVRAFATGRHRITDEPPFGGGAGMVMKVEPLVRAIRWAIHHGPEVPAPHADAHDTRVDTPGAVKQGHVILMDPAGAPFTQDVARRLAALPHLVLVCGRYEGVDERVRSHVDEEIRVSEAVVTGGELPALVVADAVVRLLPGALGNPGSTLEESHAGGLLEYPQFTRPREFEGMCVPDVLISGNHADVAQWRRQQSLLRTRERMPERFKTLQLSARDVRLLAQADGKVLSAISPPAKPK